MEYRPPPPVAPPSYAFVTRVYRRNLRPVVVAYNANKVGTFSIIIGALYLGVFGIEAFGIFAAASQKIPFVRMYAYLSALVTLIVMVASLIQVVIHFTLKSEIINTCTNFNEGDTVFYGSIFGPVRSDTLSKEDAQDWCNRSWNRGSWSNILSFLLTSVIAGFFTVVVFSYLRQVLDPSHPGNVLREPASHRMGNFPSHYNPPYNPGGGAPGYYPAYPAPAGPPPNHNNSDAFVPPYENDNKPPGYIRGEDYKGELAEQQKGGGYAWASEDAEGPSERDVTSRPTPNPFR
ncbi:hypothetical protein CVT25_014250 [Psilocybe cyanescens]|uniref:Uncharacterized protein n=1 Tax=Psilocybe cyanescens TaxID=93625 RepID=A0A409VPC0_PSICY|nr:hypothetical protein CVT25_014250 [Psilocybe cyanescens]